MQKNLFRITEQSLWLSYFFFSKSKTIFPTNMPDLPFWSIPTSLPSKSFTYTSLFRKVCECPPNIRSIPRVPATTSSSLIPSMFMPKCDIQIIKSHFFFCSSLIHSERMLSDPNTLTDRSFLLPPIHQALETNQIHLSLVLFALI